jgi:F420-non-reducing hydrogenase iron-sulfur subunit
MKKKIVAFVCENSAQKAAAQVQEAGVLEAVELVRLPCSGKIEIGLILKCLEEGHPGVLVLGCPIDNCKYLKGNLRARKRVELVKKALKDAGLPEELVHIDFLSSVDSHKLVDIVQSMRARLAAAAAPVAAGAGA